MELPSLEVGKWTLAFSGVTGRVLDTSKRSETRFSGGGGGARPGQDSVDPVHISSTVTTKHEFWINDEVTGREWAVQLAGVDLPLRTGQRVTMVSATATRGDKAGLANVLLVNHDAGKFWTLRGGGDLANHFFGRAGNRAGLGCAIALLLVTGGSIVALGGADSGRLAMAAVMVALAVGPLKEFLKIPGVKPISAHLDEVGRAALRDGGPQSGSRSHETKRGQEHER